MKFVQTKSGIIYLGDCRDVMKTLPDNSVDAIVTDPPAGISFMNKGWDANHGSRDRWIDWMCERMVEAIRVIKPGGHALVWALPRTSHWTATACEDAGFEIRDRVSHLFGQGFPKSLNVSVAIDKAAGMERVPTGRVKPGHEGFANRGNLSSVQSLKGTLGGEGGFARPWMDDPVKVEAYHQETAPATEDAKQWGGWHTALKPACEDWWLCRKPLEESTVAANVLKYGTGAINVDACRVPVNGDVDDKRLGGIGSWGTESAAKNVYSGVFRGERVSSSELGRFPPNVTIDTSWREYELRGDVTADQKSELYRWMHENT